MSTCRLILGDVRETLAEIPDESVQCVVTSPVATGHGRDAILCELNPEYAPLIRQRVGPMFVTEADHA